MIDSLLVQIATSALAGGVVATALTLYANRRLTSAQTQGVQVAGEVSIADVTMDFVRELREEIADLRRQVHEWDKRYEGVARERAHLRGENRTLAARVHALEAENKGLHDDMKQLRSEIREMRQGGSR